MWTGSSWLTKRDYAIGPITGMQEYGDHFNWSPNHYIEDTARITAAG